MNLMSNETLKTFPDSYAEALAMLYLQNQDLREKTPSEIHTMYQEAYYEILKDHRIKAKSGWFKDLKAID